MFEWAKKGGALTEHTRGIVFGLHLAGWSVPDIADRLGMSQQGVRQSVALSEKTVGGQRADEPERGPTTTSQKKGEIASRRRVVARLMRKRDRDGNYVVESSRDPQAALLDEGPPNSCVRHARRRGEVRLAAKDRRPHCPAYEEARRCREGPAGRTGGEDSVLG